MKLKEIKSNMVVHCNTEEEAKELIKWAYECGFKWKFSSKEVTHWDDNKYNIGLTYYTDNRNITYTYAEDHVAKEFSDLIISDEEPKFKVGDIVKCRDEKELNQFYEILSINEDGHIHAINRNNEKDFTIADIYPNTFNNFDREHPEELTAAEAIKFKNEMCNDCYNSSECIFKQKYSEKISISCNEWTREHPEEVIESLKQYKKNHSSIQPKEPEIEWGYECYNLDEGENHNSIIYSDENDAIKFCELWTVRKDSKLGYTYRKVCRVKEN